MPRVVDDRLHELLAQEMARTDSPVRAQAMLLGAAALTQFARSHTPEQIKALASSGELWRFLPEPPPEEAAWPPLEPASEAKRAPGRALTDEEFSAFLNEK